MAELVVVDTTKIQDYIFGSNRLRENIGASYLVEEATKTWVLETITNPEIARKHNIKNASKHELDENRCYENGLDVEVIYVGGGNALIIFRESQNATKFIRQYSLRVLEQAPNLQVVIARKSFDWDLCDAKRELATKVFELFSECLPRQKRLASPSQPLLGLGVTSVCSSTGLPAVDMTPPIDDGETTERYQASAEILAKWHHSKKANGRLKNYIDLGGHFDFPYQLDDLGRTKGEHSYIAIVHIDGDGIGGRLEKLGEGLANREYIKTRRNFSNILTLATNNALNTTTKKLIAALTYIEDKGWALCHSNAYGDLLNRIELKTVKGYNFLPFRPLVFGGDDVTFVCDGRLSIALAITYAEAFAQETLSLGLNEGKATATAGIAIVKNHYPFSRAYKLAEELTKNAKLFRKQQNINDSGCIDWFFVPTGLIGTLKTMRQHHYCVSAGSLTLCPVSLESNPMGSFRTWDVIRRGIHVFQDLDQIALKPTWTNRRNKLKALRDSLQDGQTAVQKFLQLYNIKTLPDLGEDGEIFSDNNGWSGEYCGYYDALELADWYMPLTGGQCDDRD